MNHLPHRMYNFYFSVMKSVISKQQSLNFPCDECTERFSSRRDLANHKIKTKHAVVKLVCAWCCQATIREYHYPQDLRRHVRSQHPTIHDQLPPRVLSTTSCFYFARNPATYKELFGNSSYEQKPGVSIF